MNSKSAIVWTLLLPAAFLLVGKKRDACGSEPAESTTALDMDPRDLGFAYDPREEEGPHPDSDFEWWYQFGFLKQRDSKEYDYSFVCSFQRNPKGRYLFYNLCDLRTGETEHFAIVDKSLLGGWRVLLPPGHEFMATPEQSSEKPKRQPWLIYGENQLLKQEGAYELHFKNEQYHLELTLRSAGPPMPVLGTGLTGLSKPEDQHYYSYPRMSASGLLRMEDREVELVGEFWYDHQWGVASSKTLMKWCWWGLQLDNGKNIGLFFLQDMRSGETVQQGLTLHHEDGTTDVCRSLKFTSKRKWKSPKRRMYVVEWEVESAELDLTLQIRPFTDNHEIPALLYGRIWEGPCHVSAKFGDGPVVGGRGFQELIGQNSE